MKIAKFDLGKNDTLTIGFIEANQWHPTLYELIINGDIDGSFIFQKEQCLKFRDAIDEYFKDEVK